MKYFSQPGTSEQRVLDEGMTPPAGWIEMQYQRPWEGYWVSNEAGEWIPDPARVDLFHDENSQSRADRELVKLHKTSPNTAFKKLLDNVIRGKEEIDR
ncbi:MAG: hypothetical protein JAY71_18735 [Candidatus Thiodiazotropha weberae]|nr:hypothetical protein [Candidatus Thiodiazotropha weberae]